MIKNFNIKFLPVILILSVNFYPVDIKAVENDSKNRVLNNVEILQKEYSKVKIKKSGFLKEFFEKITVKIKKISRRIVKFIKRKISKRKSKKDRMKAGLSKRNKNLFNILVFSALFILSASLIVFLFYSSVISSAVFLVLGIALIISSLVISLIYLSNRYILKPHYRS